MDVHDSYKIGESVRMKRLFGGSARCMTALLLAVLLVLNLTGCSGAQKDDSGSDDAEIQEVLDTSPHTKPDGSRFRIAYVDYDEYMPASRQLYYILKGLEEEGWIKQNTIPFSADSIEREETSTKQMYEKLLSADLGEYIEFAKDGFYYLGYDDEQRVATDIKERAGKDFDLIITFGTSAGVLVSGLGLTIPMVDFSATDAVASGIIESSTEGSGNPYVWAQVEPFVPLRQLKYYHSIKPFNNLGVIVYNDEIISGIPDVMSASKEVGFKVNKHFIPEQPRETKEELNAYYELVKSEFEKIAKEDIDAFFLTPDLINDLEYLKDILKPLYDRKIPVYVFDDTSNVSNGALLIISAYDIENVGRFVAEAITKILNGAEAGSLPCVYTSAPYICFNLDVAEQIDYPLNFEFLAICDEIYTERKQN